MFNCLTLNLTSILSRLPIIIFLWPFLNLTSIFRILVLKMLIFVKVFTGCAISFFLVVESSFVWVCSGHIVITGLSISVYIHNPFICFHLIIVIITSRTFIAVVGKLIISFLKFPLLLIRSISLLDFHSSIFLIIIINRFL